MNKETFTDAGIKSLAKHPYLWALGICLFVNPFFLGSIQNIPDIALWVETFFVIGTIAAFGMYQYRSGRLSRTGAAICVALFTLADCFAVRLYQHAQYQAVWHFVGGCAAAAILYLLIDQKKFRTQANALLIMGLGFCLKLYYILVTSVYTRQHDVHTFGGESGHAAYIEYLLFHRGLPDFDVRERWQFCHPPLHHAISAIWIFVNENILMTGPNPARESLQTLTLFYSMCIMISAYKLLRHFGLKGSALYIPLTIVSFHPAFILFSGSINNDPLSAALVIGAMVCTLKWYREQSVKNILKIALCLGFAMMAKISAATLAPPIALLFLIVLIRNCKGDWKRLFMQFVCFGIVCIPLGLWFGIRNYINWGVPLTYVQEMDKGVLQYIGDRSFLSRVTDFSSFQFASPYEQWARRNESGAVYGYNEYNPLIACMKNALFGEYINENCFTVCTYINTVAKVLFWLNIVIAGFALVSMAVLCFKKCSAKPTEKLFLTGFYVVMMASFYKTAADYPFTCTMNFRYITPTVIIGAIFIGLAVTKMQEREKLGRIAAICLYAGAILFAFYSGAVYLSLG